MLKRIFPNATFLGFLVIIFFIRITIFFRQKTDPTALDAYNLVQIGIVTLLGILLLIRRDSSYIVNILIHSPLGWLVILYTFGIISGLWSAIPPLSTYFGVEGLIFIIVLAVILFHQADQIRLERFAIFFSLGLISLHLIVLIKMMGVSISLSHWHSNSYPGIAAMLFSYCAGEYFNRYRLKSKQEKKILKWGMLLSLVFIILGTSSGSNIAVASAVLVLILISGRRFLKIFALLIVTVYFLIDISFSDLIFEVLFPSKSQSGVESFGGRSVIWEYYFGLIKDRPIVGYGFAALSRITKLYNIHAHNSLIDVTGGLGVIGLLFFLLYITRVYLIFLKNIKAPYILGSLGAITAGLVNSNTISIIGSPTGTLFVAFIVWNLIGWYTIIGINKIDGQYDENYVGNTQFPGLSNSSLQ